MAPLKISRRFAGLVVVNGLTTLRLFCAFFISYFACKTGSVNMSMLQIGLFGGFSDFLDGWLADPKRLDARSDFGALYDKGADKVFVISIAFSLIYCTFGGFFILNVTAFLVYILTFMELFLAITGGIYSVIKKGRLEANCWGKAKMWAEGIALCVWAIFLIKNPSGKLFLQNSYVVNYIFIIAIALACKSAYDYWRDATRV